MAEYLLFTASHDKTLRKWSFETGTEIVQIKPKDAQINSMVVNDDGKILGTGGYCTLKLYDTNNLDIIWSNNEAHTKNVQTIGFFKNGYEMFTGGEDGIAKIWDIRANKYSCEKAYQMPSPLNGLSLHPNQNDLIVADAQGIIYIWDLSQDVDSTVPIQELDITEFFNHVHVDITGDQVCAVSNRGKVYIIGRTNEVIKRKKSMDGRFQDINSIPNINNVKHDKSTLSLLMTSEISTIVEEVPVNPNEGYCVQASSYKFEHFFKAHRDYVLKCRYSKCGRFLGTSGADGKVNIYKYQEFKDKNYQPYRQIPNPKKYTNNESVPDLKWIWGLEFSNDGKYLFTSGGDHTFRVWNIEEEQNIIKFSGHSGTVTGLAIYDSNPSLMKPKTADIISSLQRFADAQREPSSRAKHFKIAFEGLPISEKRQIIEDYHFEAIHLVDSLVLHQEISSDIQAANDAESALWTLEQILCYGPEIVGKGWQWNAISTIIKRCLLPQNGSSLKRVAVRLFIMWYQILAVNNNVTPELDKVFQSLLPYFPLKNGENTEQILLNYCEKPIDNSNNLPPNIVLSRKLLPLFVPANMTEIQHLLQTNTKERAKQLQTWIDKFLEYICRETQKIEWGDQSKRFDCAKFLLDRMINLYILEVYPDLESNGVDIFGGWEGEPNTTDILDTADPIVIVRYWLIRWILNIASAKTVSNPSTSLLLFRSALFSNPRAINIMLSLLKESMCLPLACSTVTLRCMTLVKHWLTQKEIPPFLETGNVSLQSFSLLLIHVFSSFFNSPYIYASPEKINTAITISNFAIQIFRDMANSSNILPRTLPKGVWNELIKQLTNITINVCKLNDSFSHSTSSAFTQALLVVTTFVYCVREIDIDDSLFDDIWILFKTTVWSGTLDQWSKFVEMLTKSIILNVFGIDPTNTSNNDDSDKSTSKKSYTKSDRSEKSDTGSNPDFPRSEADEIDDCQNSFDSSNNKEMQSLIRSTGNPEKWLKLWVRIINMVDPSKAAFSQVAVQVLSQIIQMLIPINCANTLVHHIAQRLLMVDIKAQPHAIPSLCSVLVTSSPPPLLRAHILIKLEDCLTTDIAPIVLEQVPSMKLEDIFILHKPIIEALQIIIKNGEISSKIVRVTSLLSLEQTDAEKLLLTILTQQHYMEMDLSTLTLLVNSLSILILERGDVTLGMNLYKILLKNQSLSIPLTYLLIRNLDELKKRGKRNFLRQSLEQIINMLKVKDENIIKNELLWMLITLICDGKRLPLDENNGKGSFEKILSLLNNHDKSIKNSFLEGLLLTNTVFYPLPGFSLSQWNSIDSTTPIPGKIPNKNIDKDYENQVFIKNRGVLINVDRNVPSEIVIRTVVGKHVWSIKNVDEIDINGKYHPHIKGWLKNLSNEKMEQEKRTIKIEEKTTHEIDDNFFDKLPTFPKNYKDPIEFKPMLDFIKKSKRRPLSRPSTSDINKTTPSDNCCLVADNKEELGTWRQFVNDIQLIHQTCEIKSNFPRELRHLDTTLSREVHKIAVIYVGKGQEDKTTILSNTISDSSEEFMELINSLGRIVVIGENHYGYGGGLSIGHKAPYYADGSTEVIFHISTFLTGDVTQKTKHLGNDEVHVVWNENYKNYKRDTIATKFCDILIVLTPISPAMIRVSIETQKPLSFGPLFDGSFVSICEIGPMVRETALNASRAYKVDRINCDRPLKHRENVYKECLDKVGYAKMADAITNIYIPQLKN